MKKTTRACITAALGLASAVAFAVPPRQLITHNTTDLDSNAYVAGTVPSQHPTKAHTDGKVLWASVRMACYGHVVNGKCPALIKVGANTDHPIELGMLYMDLSTGIITPSELHAGGYAMIVNGPAETTLYQE
ncbi:MAG: hypothetical protein P1U39_01595 [Legionellaceae bacterium]|nr:hypothetical protein [Legionellaceae bacterium]